MVYTDIIQNETVTNKKTFNDKTLENKRHIIRKNFEFDRIINGTFSYEDKFYYNENDYFSIKFIDNLNDALELTRMYVARPEFNKSELMKLGVIMEKNVKMIMSSHCSFN